MHYQEKFRDSLTGAQTVFYEQIKNYKCRIYWCCVKKSSALNKCMLQGNTTWFRDKLLSSSCSSATILDLFYHWSSIYLAIFIERLLGSPSSVENSAMNKKISTLTKLVFLYERQKKQANKYLLWYREKSHVRIQQHEIILGFEH